MYSLKRTLLVLSLFVALIMSPISADAASDQKDTVAKAGIDTSLPDDYMLLSIFLKHDQSKTLKQIAGELKETGFWAKFPPQGVEVESWYVMMGIGQVVTLRVPPARLREVNRAIELYGWGAFRTEFYATYDLRGTANKLRAKALETMKTK